MSDNDESRIEQPDQLQPTDSSARAADWASEDATPPAEGQAAADATADQPTRVDQPAVETGPLYRDETTPPQQPGPQPGPSFQEQGAAQPGAAPHQPGAAQQPYAAATAPSSNRTARIVIIGALVLGLLALGFGAWTLFGRALGLGGGNKNSVALADLHKEPSEAWVTDLVDRANTDWVRPNRLVKLDDNTLAVHMAVESGKVSSAQGQNVGWYEGYDAQYAKGLEGGKAAKATDQASGSFATPNVNQAQYWPTEYGIPHQQGVNDPKYRGWLDGYYDGYEGTSNRKNNHVAVPTLGSVSVIDLGSGAIRWAIDGKDLGLTETAPSGLSMVRGDTGDVVVGTTLGNGNEMDVRVLSAAKGEELRSATLPGSRFVVEAEKSGIADAGQPVLVTGSQNGKGFVTAFSASDPEKELWRLDFPGTVDARLTGGFVYAKSNGVLEVFNAKTGEAPKWAEPEKDSTELVAYKDGALRHERVSNYSSVSLLDANGKTRWETDFDSASVLHYMGQPLILEYQNSGNAVSGFQPINPDTGKGMWKHAYSGALKDVQIMPGHFVVSDGSRLLVLDAGSGEKVATLRGTEALVGNDTIYVRESDRLMAYSVKGDKLWDMRLRSDQVIQQVPGKLITLDSARRQLSAWR